MIYKLLKYSNDLKAIKNGRVSERIKFRVLAKLFWKIVRKVM